MSKDLFRIYDRIASIVLSITVVLGMFAFVPGGMLSGVTLKGYILVVGVSLALAFFIVGRLIEGRISAPRTWIMPATGILALALFLSTLFSHTPHASLFGEGLEQGAFVPLCALFALLFLSSILFSEERRFLRILSGAFIAYIVIALYQLAHLFFPAATSFGVFSSTVSTPVGSWSDFAYLSGAALIGSVLTLQLSKPQGRARMLAILGGILSIFFIALANVFLCWILVGCAMLAILIYALMRERAEGERQVFPFLPFFITVAAIFFIITASTLGFKLADALHAPYFGANPSASATVSVGLHSLRAHPVFGSGLNTFSHEWLAYRPSSVNSTILWDTQFSSGASLLFTDGILAGVVGLLALVFFLFAYFREGVRAAFRRPKKASRTQRSEAAVFGILLFSVYFMLVVVLSSPGVSLAMLAFFFAGLMLAVLAREGRIASRTFVFLGSHRAIILSVAVSLVAIAIIIFGMLGATRRVSAQVSFARGVALANSGDFVGADAHFVKATTIENVPSFERARVVIAGQQLKQIVSAVPSGQDLSADQKQQAESAVQVGNAAALAAIALDPTDVQNYLVYGDFMHSLMSFKIPNAFENARDAYLQGAKASPDYPKSYYALAGLYADNGDTANAKKYADLALSKKANYTEVYVLEEQMSYSAGDMDSAKGYLNKAASLDPNNPDVYADIGFLDYQTGDYDGSVRALRNATNLGANDANTWYYYALALTKTGDTKNASLILSTLHVRLPDDKNIASALFAITAPAAPVTPLGTDSSASSAPDAAKKPATASTSTKPKK